MPHSVGPQENGSGTLPCQRRSHAQGSIFRRGPQTGPGRAAHHSPETHLHPGNPAYHGGTGIPVGGDFPQLFLCLLPHQGGSDRRGALSAAAPSAGICPQPDGRPDNQLVGRSAAVPGYLLLWRQEWSGGAQCGRAADAVPAAFGGEFPHLPSPGSGGSLKAFWRASVSLRNRIGWICSPICARIQFPFHSQFQAGADGGTSTPLLRKVYKIHRGMARERLPTGRGFSQNSGSEERGIGRLSAKDSRTAADAVLYSGTGSFWS